MADIKKFLDQSGVSILWTKIAEQLKNESDRAKAAEAANATAAKAAQDDVDALETYVGTIPESYTETNVIAYINKKAEETLNAANGGSNESAATVKAALDAYIAKNDPLVKANTDAIDAIEADYLVEADKTELDGKIAANTTEIARVNSVLVSALENEGAGLDSIKELATWIETHGEEAAGYAEAITALEGKVDTGDQKVSEYVAAAVAALNIADYAKAADLLALAARVTTAEGKITTLEGNDADKETRIAAMEAKVTKWDAAEANAKAYADGLATNYDPAGTAQTKVDALANGQVKTNTDAIAVLNGSAWTNGSVAKALKDAKAYTDQQIEAIPDPSWNDLTDKPVVYIEEEIPSALNGATISEDGMYLEWDPYGTDIDVDKLPSYTFYFDTCGETPPCYRIYAGTISDLYDLTVNMEGDVHEGYSGVYLVRPAGEYNNYDDPGYFCVVVNEDNVILDGVAVPKGIYVASSAYISNRDGFERTTITTIEKLAIEYLPDHSHDDQYYTEAEIDSKLQKNASAAQTAASQALTDAKAYTDSEINTKVIALTEAEIDSAIANATTGA